MRESLCLANFTNREATNNDECLLDMSVSNDLLANLSDEDVNKNEDERILEKENVKDDEQKEGLASKLKAF